MALKDWTKISKEQWVKNWNGYDGSPSLFVYKQDYDDRTFINLYGKPKRPEWFVDLDAEKTLGTFKTKSEALAYAKSYMRSH